MQETLINYRLVEQTDDLLYMHIMKASLDFVNFRKEFKWTSHFNKDGTRLKIPIKRSLCDLETSHIINILQWLNGNSSRKNTFTVFVLLTELQYRNQNEKQS